MKLHQLLACSMLCLTSSAPIAAAVTVHGPSQAVAPMPLGPKIKVLLEKEVPSAFLETRGSYRVVRKDNEAVLSSGFIGKRFVVHALQEGLRWGEEYPDVYQISIVPQNSESYVFVNGIQYKGSVSIFHVKDNYITIVNEVPIEDYIKSTLAIEFDAPLSKEAMAAVAIVARSEAYHLVQMGKKSSLPWDVAAKDANYYGHGVTLRKNGVEEAVDWSRYMVLESTRTGSVVNDVALLPDAAEKLAKKGYDAQKILLSNFPQTKMGATINASEVAVR